MMTVRFGWRTSCLLVSGLQGLSLVVVVLAWLVNNCRNRKKTLERNKLLASNGKTYGTINNSFSF